MRSWSALMARAPESLWQRRLAPAGLAPDACRPTRPSGRPARATIEPLARHHRDAGPSQAAGSCAVQSHPARANRVRSVQSAVPGCGHTFRCAARSAQMLAGCRNGEVIASRGRIAQQVDRAIPADRVSRWPLCAHTARSHAQARQIRGVKPGLLQPAAVRASTHENAHAGPGAGPPRECGRSAAARQSS